MATLEVSLRISAGERLRVIVGTDHGEARASVVAPNAAVHIFDESPARLAAALRDAASALEGEA